MHENDVPSDIHCGLILDYFSILQRSSLNTAHECIERYAHVDIATTCVVRCYRFIMKKEPSCTYPIDHTDVYYTEHSKISLTLSQSTVVIILLELKHDIFYKSSLTFIGLAIK